MSEFEFLNSDVKHINWMETELKKMAIAKEMQIWRKCQTI